MGTAYSGWQRQDDAVSIQQTIEDALVKLYSDGIYIVGCGRTDAGVHASQYYFHVDIPQLPEYDLRWRLNKMLPDDIAIHEIIPVEDSASARFDALSRRYRFHFHINKDPFLAMRSTYVDVPSLDVDKMKAALGLLPLNNDYTSFCKTPDRHNTCICHIDEATLIDNGNGIYQIVIKGNRFLRAMIRIITYRVIMVGSGKLTVADFEQYFSQGNRGEQVVLMPPQGLFLDEIRYSFDLGESV